MRLRSVHDYYIRAYRPTNLGGGLLIETWHDGEASRDMEIAVFKDRMRRGDIERIEIESHVEPVGITTIYATEVKKGR